MFGDLMGRIAGRFTRVEPRRRAGAFVLGLLADLPRKNCWTIAEHAGDATPDGMQHLLAGARWDADGVRDDLRDYIIGQLSDPDAVLVVDETGDLKMGTATAGVQRPYTGTAGRIENSPGGSVPHLCRPGRARAHRPGALPAEVMDRRPGPLPGGRHPRRHGVRDQAGAGAADDRPHPGRRGTSELGCRGRGLWRRPCAARKLDRIVELPFRLNG